MADAIACSFAKAVGVEYEYRGKVYRWDFSEMRRASRWQSSIGTTPARAGKRSTSGSANGGISKRVKRQQSACASRERHEPTWSG